MTTVNPLAGGGAPASSAQGVSSLADPTTFLKLLVAQLKYQNPLNPTSGTQFLSQTAQLTEVQTLTSLAATMTSQLASDRTLAAAALVGRKVTGVGPAGTAVSGTVGSVALTGSGQPTLDVSGTDVPLSSVTQIS